MKRQAKSIDGRLEKMRRDAFVDFGEGIVGSNEIPVAVERKGGKGLLAFEKEVDGFAHGLEYGVVDGAFGKHGRKACGDEKDVAVAHGDGELLGEMKNHFAAGLRAARFEEAEMARGDFGFAGEVELA